MTTSNLPADVKAALAKSKAAQTKFSQLPPSHQREYLKHIAEAKKTDTRARRIAQMLARLTEVK